MEQCRFFFLRTYFYFYLGNAVQTATSNSKTGGRKTRKTFIAGSVRKVTKGKKIADESGADSSEEVDKKSTVYP